MAVSNEQAKCRSCNSCSNLENKNVAVFELEGLEKNKVLAKALKNKEAKKLIEVLVNKGYKPELAKATVKEVLREHGTFKYTFIPFSRNGKIVSAGIGYIETNSIQTIVAVVTEKTENKVLVKYYFVDSNGFVKYRTMSGDEDYWSCWAQCMAQECMPIPGVPPTGLCDLCWAALEVCLMFPGPQNPSCIAAACFGVQSFACGYECSQ
jgi:hypothetical protein